MNKTKRPCSARCLDGTPCRAWAVRGIRAARCAVHGGRGHVTVATRHAARVQHLWLDEALLPDPLHVPPLTGVILDEEEVPAHYAVHYSDEEIGFVRTGLHSPALHGELGLVRIALHRLFAGFSAQQGLTVGEMNERGLTLFSGVKLVAHLLTTQLTLGESGMSRGEKAIDLALQELAEELGLDG